MSTTCGMNTYEAMAAQAVHDVFTTMLRYEVRESADDYVPRACVETFAIFFTGEWTGAVIAECGEAQCRFFAQRLMGIPEPPSMDDDVRDAMGEVLNMIGGNLKAVFPPGVTLSLPVAIESTEYVYQKCGSDRVARFSFRGEIGPLWITLVHVAERTA